MPLNVTTIGHESTMMRTYVYSDFSRVCIAQGMWQLIDDVVDLTSKRQARQLVAYLEARIKDAVWGAPAKPALAGRGKKVILMSTREAFGYYGAGVMIEQNIGTITEDCILADSPERARKLINAIRKRAKEVDWEV